MKKLLLTAALLLSSTTYTQEMNQPQKSFEDLHSIVAQIADQLKHVNTKSDLLQKGIETTTGNLTQVLTQLGQILNHLEEIKKQHPGQANTAEVAPVTTETIQISEPTPEPTPEPVAEPTPEATPIETQATDQAISQEQNTPTPVAALELPAAPATTDMTQEQEVNEEPEQQPMLSQEELEQATQLEEPAEVLEEENNEATVL